MMVGPRGLCTNATTASQDCIESYGHSGWSFREVEVDSFGAIFLAYRTTRSELDQKRGIGLFN